ncbi:D-alanyl-D-alanine carboxypeptidase [Desulfosporosinus fructosivorans]|uniref:serine-type D-Ala-D-Ala carboxypeptidase n=1 Tax=Desulfosporosinus fructosivorans TaxID=2018669 RepID=A0A4Z0R0Z2_9FIRM|nr:D-alanyl-D-alanine carboxypeptidase family protein [Desulfosporosinus fructosivorans]TGE35296.1 D-alanyl-D-alanine carboxypeptidase [Desulfosporosinus fructosivorans]
MIRQKWTCAWCYVFLCIVSISNLSSPSVYGAEPKEPVAQPVVIADGPTGISAAAAVLMDVTTGDILFGKQADTQRPPASTTKIMTAILGLELGSPDEVVTVSKKAAAVGEATLHLDPGEKITLYELITGALVRSGNDACVAIAEHISGSEEQFVKLMNKKAMALGAQNTNFVNTNGLPRKEHYTTARDLALMARHGLQIPQFSSITRQKETEIHFLEPDVFMDLRNTNKLLWNYPYANGVKTGTTTAAGKCLVASATKDERQLLAVVLNAPDRFGDAKKLLEWGFEKTETIRLVEAGQAIAEFPSAKKSVQVFIDNPIDVSISKVKRQSLQTRVVWEKTAYTPVRAGERLGHLEVWLGEQKLNCVPLISEKEVTGDLLDTLFK